MGNIQRQASTYLAAFLKSIQQYTGNLNLPDFNLVTIIILFVLLMVFLFGVTFGRSRLLIGLLSLYVARVLESVFPYFDWIKGQLKNTDVSIIHAGLFIVIFMVTFILLERSVLRARLGLSEASVVFVGILSILELGFLVSIASIYLPTEVYRILPAQVLEYFNTKTAQFWWSAAPILSLLFMRKHKKD